MDLKTALFVCMCLYISGSRAQSDVLDPGEPLYLTPLIEKGQLDYARMISRVDPMPEECTDNYRRAYSGYITVDKQYDSNMFFWFMEPRDIRPKTAPIMFYFDGGPGASSMLSLFAMLGPYKVGKNISMTKREEDWTRKCSIVFVDNPIGAGFSYTKNDAGYSRNQSHVAENVYKFMEQFFTLFPKTRERKQGVYLGGSSYGGKHVPSIAYKIHLENAVQPPEKRIPLSGLIIGAPFFDPPNIISEYGDYLYYTGLMNRPQADAYKAEMAKTTQAVRAMDLPGAQKTFFDAMVNNYENNTGYTSMFNILMAEATTSDRYFPSYVRRADVRRAIHAGNIPFSWPVGEAGDNLRPQFLRAEVVPFLEQLLNANQYKILFYSGHLDVIVNLPGVRKALESMTNWNDVDAFKNAPKKIWKLKPDDQDVAGYVQSVGNFTHLTVIGAGHLGPDDQPERHFDMVTRYLEDIPFSSD